MQRLGWSVCRDWGEVLRDFRLRCTTVCMIAFLLHVHVYENKFSENFCTANIQNSKIFPTMNEWTCEIITVGSISAFAVVLKSCHSRLINRLLSYSMHRDPMHLYTRGVSNTTALFEYTFAILVARFVWQPTSLFLRLMLISFCSSGTNRTRVY